MGRWSMRNRVYVNSQFPTPNSQGTPNGQIPSGGSLEIWPLGVPWRLEVGDWELIDPLHNGGAKPRERPHVAHPVPRVLPAGRLALGLVPLQEARHEELLRQRRQPHPARPAVIDDAGGLIGIDD